MKNFVIGIVLFIIVGFVIYNIISVILALLITMGVMFAFIPVGLSVLLKYLFYVLGAILLIWIVKWVLTNKK